jgi:hypothetical protein
MAGAPPGGVPPAPTTTIPPRPSAPAVPPVGVPPAPVGGLPPEPAEGLPPAFTGGLPPAPADGPPPEPAEGSPPEPAEGSPPEPSIPALPPLPPGNTTQTPEAQVRPSSQAPPCVHGQASLPTGQLCSPAEATDPESRVVLPQAAIEHTSAIGPSHLHPRHATACPCLLPNATPAIQLLRPALYLHHDCLVGIRVTRMRPPGLC